jgi:superfamily II DNA or RNA helicase
MQRAFEGIYSEPVGVISEGKFNPEEKFTVAMVQTLAQALDIWDVKTELKAAVRKITEKDSEEIKERRQLLLDSGLKGKELMLELEKFSIALEKGRAKRLPELREKVAKDVEKHNAKRQQVIAYLKTVEFVALEEAHEVGGDSYFKVVNYCTNAHYRLALTATPFMKTDARNIRLQASSGEVGYEVTEATLINSGVLAKPYFKFVSYSRPAKLGDVKNWHQAYDLGVVNSDTRNAAVIKEAIIGIKRKLPTLILVARQNHGRKLERFFTSNGIRAEFIFGESSAEKRERALAKLERGDIQVLIGSTILDVGVDVPSIGMLILAAGEQDEVRLRQRIGRALRRKKSGPNVAFIVDFNDEHVGVLRKHSRIRKGVIQSTEGFSENVVKEFPWELFD